MNNDKTKLLIAAFWAVLILLPDSGQGESEETLPRVLTQAVAPALAEGDLSGLAAGAAQAGFNWPRTGVGSKAPAWVKRTEFQFDFQEDTEPVWSILTVQPLYQAIDLRRTYFTQARIARHNKFGDSRTTANLGLGYRHLFHENTLLLGVNSFFDYESEMDHTRFGGGFEAKWYSFDFFTNYYKALSDTRVYGDAAGSGTEKALDGFDLELTSQVPHLRWMRVRGKYYQYDSDKAIDDVDGWSYSVEMDLHPNLTFEIGAIDDNYTDNSAFAKFTIRHAESSRTTASKKLVSDEPFEMRDMSSHTLDKVRRTNTIRVERSAAGTITISRQ